MCIYIYLTSMEVDSRRILTRILWEDVSAIIVAIDAIDKLVTNHNLIRKI